MSKRNFGAKIAAPSPLPTLSPHTPSQCPPALTPIPHTPYSTVGAHFMLLARFEPKQGQSFFFGRSLVGRQSMGRSRGVATKNNWSFFGYPSRQKVFFGRTLTFPFVPPYCPPPPLGGRSGGTMGLANLLVNCLPPALFLAYGVRFMGNGVIWSLCDLWQNDDNCDFIATTIPPKWPPWLQFAIL